MLFKNTYVMLFLELPEEALREALINAIAHRDYFSPAPIIVNIFIDKVEILNPVNMDSSITVEDLMRGSYPRNLFLFSCLERIELVEKAGSGILRIKDALKAYKLPMAEIEFSKRLFTTTFLRPDLQKNGYKKRVLEGKTVEKSSQKSSQKTTMEITQKTAQKILLLIQENPQITIEELSKTLELSDRAIKKQLANLKQQGIIERVGPDKGGHWEIVEK